jgi:hypothetical protein
VSTKEGGSVGKREMSVPKGLGKRKFKAVIIIMPS